MLWLCVIINAYTGDILGEHCGSECMGVDQGQAYPRGPQARTEHVARSGRVTRGVR